VVIQAFRPAQTLVSADRYEARNPLLLLHSTVVRHTKKANAKKPKELALSKPTTRQ